MIPWEKIDTAKIPGSDEELRLMRRGKEFSIKLGTNELMNNRLSGSEAALATLAAKQLETVAKPVVLIGGLGMGFAAARGAYSARKQSENRGLRARAGGCRLGAGADGGSVRRQSR